MAENKEQVEAVVTPTPTEITYTQAQFESKLTSEVDRRVESGIQKGLQTQRDKWKEELQKEANLTAEERAKKEFDDKIAELQTKEIEVSRRANKLDAQDKLSEAGVPKSQRERVISMIVSEDKELTDEKVKAFIDIFNDTKNEVETQVRSTYSKVNPPSSGGSATPTNKEAFTKMTYSDKMQFKKEHPEEFKQFIK